MWARRDKGIAMTEWDVFISHASEDKAAVARPLADILAASGVTVWLDEAELILGDSLREKIDAGLNQSQFGVVIPQSQFLLEAMVQLRARRSHCARVGYDQSGITCLAQSNC